MPPSERKAFLLRVPADLWKDLEKWAADDLRSINAQIEFLLRDGLAKRGIVPKRGVADKPGDGGEDE